MFIVAAMTTGMVYCAARPGPARQPMSESSSAGVRAPEKSQPQMQEGTASFYGHQDGFDGKKTASGEIFDADHLTAAHRTLPFGTRVKVTNLENGREAEVTINDRGPAVKGRIIDLSHAAAEQLGFLQDGSAKVRLEW